MTTRTLLVLCLMPAVAHADAGLEIGAAFGAHAFSGNGELGVADRATEPGPVSSVALGARAAYPIVPRVAIEAEVVAIPTKDDLAGAGALALGLRTHARIDLLHGRLRPFVLAGLGMHVLRTSSPEMTNDADQAYHWGAGVRWAVSPALDVRFDARHLIVPDRTLDGATSDFEITAGVSYRFGATPRAASMAGHGTLAEVQQGDRDLDTIADAVDKCPNETEDVDGFEDEDGCPELDNDQDGIADADDICPDDKEVINDYRDHDGCPDQRIEGLSNITFEHDSVTLDAKAQATVDRAFAMLTELPGLYVELAGHASAKEGAGERAQNLSLRRAEAVKAALVKRGIAAERILTVGHGAAEPLGDFAKSRRVELRTMTPDEVPL